ncbi:hypothetical protein ACJX0J_006974, partial [Zea mays]
ENNPASLHGLTKGVPVKEFLLAQNMTAKRNEQEEIQQLYFAYLRTIETPQSFLQNFLQ